MVWPQWPKRLHQDLARYVLADVADNVVTQSEDGRSSSDLLAQHDYGRLVQELYSSLCTKHDVRWAPASFDPRWETQNIRTPESILRGSGDGTCLDLAVLFAGAALGNRLVPLVVVLNGHALVAISMVTRREKISSSARAQPIEDGGEGTQASGEEPWWERSDGVLTRAEDLMRLVDSGTYILVECTGFARSQSLSPNYPEGKGRVDGRLPWERALSAGREQLDQPDRDFRFAIDPGYIQDVIFSDTYDPQSLDFGKAPGHDEGLPVHGSPPIDSGMILEDPGPRMRDRKEQQRALRQAIGSHNIRLVEVVGPTQYGKTALVSSVVRRIRNHGMEALGVAGIAQVSASERLFSFTTLTHVLMDFVPAPQRRAVRKALSSTLPAEAKTQRLLSALPGRYAVIMDHLEVQPSGLVADPEILAFIETFLAAQHASVLVTTSENPLGPTGTALSCKIPVEKGLEEKDAVSLLRAVPDRLGIVASLSEEQLRNAVKSVYYVPGLIRMIPNNLNVADVEKLFQHTSVPNMTDFHTDKTYSSLMETEQPLLKLTGSLMEKSYSTLTESERLVMEALAVLSRAERPRVLDVMVGGIPNLKEALNELVIRMFVRLNRDQTLSIREMDRDYLIRKLRSDHRDRLLQQHLSAASYYRDLRYNGPKFDPHRDIHANLLEVEHLLDGEDYERAARSLGAIQDAAIWSGDVKTVRSMLLKLSGRLLDPSLQLQQHLGLGQCSIILGPLEDAEEHLTWVMSEASKLDQFELLARARSHLGDCYRRQGNLTAAIHLLQLVIKKGGEAVVYDTSAHLDLGLCYVYAGRYGEAIKSAKTLSRIASEQHKNVFLGQAENIFALVKLWTNQLDEALKNAQSAVEHCRNENDRDGLGYVLNVTGMIQAGIGDFEAAIDCFSQGYAHCELYGGYRAGAICLANRAFVLIRTGHFTAALNDAQTALPVLMSSGTLESPRTVRLIDELAAVQDITPLIAAKALKACSAVSPRSGDLIPPQILLEWAAAIG